MRYAYWSITSKSGKPPERWPDRRTPWLWNKNRQGSGVSLNPTYQYCPSNSTGRLPARYRIVSSLRDSRTVLREATWRSIFLLISILLCSRSAFWWCHYATPTMDRNNQSVKFSGASPETVISLRMHLPSVGTLLWLPSASSPVRWTEKNTRS